MPKETFKKLPKEKQEKIIKAAKKEFARVAVSEALIKNIVEEADIARGSFYQYFDSKEELLKYILEEKMKEVEEFTKKELEKNHGDIFETYISLYDYMMKEFSKVEDFEFHKKVMENMKTSDETFCVFKEIKEADIKGPFQKDEFINKIDKSKLRLSTNEELKTLIKILFIITKKSTVANFIYKSKDRAREEYIRMLEMVKYGVYKDI